MNIIKRWICTILCMVLAIACYVFGIPAGGAAISIARHRLRGSILVEAIWPYQQK